MDNLETLKRLNRAATDGDLEIVNLILAREQTLNLNITTIELEDTALHLAALKGHVDVVRRLLSQGVSAETKDFHFKETPLHYAVGGEEKLDVIKLLVESFQHSEDRVRYVNLPNKDGRTALYYACYAGGMAASSIIEYLLAANADPNLLDNTGFSAAHHIAAKGEPDALTALLRQDPNSVSKPPGIESKGRTCIHLATTEGFDGSRNGDNIDWLLDGATMETVKTRDDSNMTAWEVAWDSATYHRVHSIGAFVLKDKRNGCINKLFDWIEHSPSWYKSECYYTFSCNNSPGIFGLMRHLRKQEKISQKALQAFAEDYGPLRGRESIFRAREPMCVFEVLKEAEKEATKTEKEVTKAEKEANMTDSKSIRERETTSGLEIDGNRASPSVLARPKDTGLITSSGALPDYLSIVMPFFHRQYMGQTRLWRNSVKRREVFTADWERCCSQYPETLGVYMSLTLDEYCSQVLAKDVLENRNNDQVYTRIKWPKQTRVASGSDSQTDTAELVAVGQAWIWNVQDEPIISPSQWPGDGIFSGLRAGDPEIGWCDVALTGDRLRCIGCVLSYLVASLDQCQLWTLDRESWQTREPILNAFEKAITLVLEDVNKYADTVGINKIRIEEERKYLHDIGDVLEELSMIKRVLLQQENVWKSFANNAWPEYWPNGQDGRMVIPRDDWSTFANEERNEWRRIIEAQSLFEKYRRRLSQLNEDAERVERSIIIKLDLKQKHTSLQESHSTAVMSAAVLGFTIVTIVFTPLSFVTSLFALPIDRFQRNMIDSDGTKSYSTSYIGKWAATTEIVSTAFAVAAIWIAIDRGMDVPLTQAILEILTRAFNRRRSHKNADQDQAGREQSELSSTTTGWWKEGTEDTGGMKPSKSAESVQIGKPSGTDGSVHKRPRLLEIFRRRNPPNIEKV